MREFIFTWNIENISFSWHKPEESIVSPTFIASSIMNTAWTLKLYPRGQKNSDYLSLYLGRENDQFPESLPINFELSCVSSDSSALHSCFIPETFTTFPKNENYFYGESRFLKRYEVFDRKKALYLPQDVLTLRCRMWKDEDEDEDGDEFGQIYGLTRLTTKRIVSVINIQFENLMKKIFLIQSKDESVTLMSVSIVYYSDKIDLEINPISGEMKTAIYKLKFMDKRTGRKLCEHMSCFFGKAHAEVFQLPFSEKVLPTENNSGAGNFEIYNDFVYSTGEEVQIIEKDIRRRIPEFISNYIISWHHPLGQSDYSTISRDLWNMYKEQIFCDVELSTPKKSFFVHQVVLCARSPVFLAMLTYEMKEKIKKCIATEDISTEVLEKFITFLYTDTFEDFEWDAVTELYYAADKYQVQRLKFKCCSYLLKNVDFDHVCELLILADRHQDIKLIQVVHDFIWKNEEQVFRSSMWKKFSVEQTELAMKTMLSKYEEKDYQSPPETIDDSKSTLSSILDDFRTLYEGQIIYDIAIKTNSTTFLVHKAVLYATSSTFRNMLTRIGQINNKNESQDIEIKDLEEDTISQMLLFLYSDSLEDVQWDAAKKLYHAANVYEIHKLKFRCSCILLDYLNVSNASDLLLLAHEHHDLKLKIAAQDFIHLYHEEIFGSNEWTAFGEANCSLAFETMCAKYKK